MGLVYMAGKALGCGTYNQLPDKRFSESGNSANSALKKSIFAWLDWSTVSS